MIGTWSKSERATWFRIFHRGMGGIYTMVDWIEFIDEVTRVKRDWERVQLMLDGFLLPTKDDAGNRQFVATDEGVQGRKRHDVERAGTWFEIEPERLAPAKPKSGKPEGFPLFERLEPEGAGVAVH